MVSGLGEMYEKDNADIPAHIAWKYAADIRELYDCLVGCKDVYDITGRKYVDVSIYYF